MAVIGEKDCGDCPRTSLRNSRTVKHPPGWALHPEGCGRGHRRPAAQAESGVGQRAWNTSQGALSAGRSFAIRKRRPADLRVLRKSTGSRLPPARMVHYVCDACHSGSANEPDPAVLLGKRAARGPSPWPSPSMKDARIKMHGPEHHFLVPAVLLSAFCNAEGRAPQEKAALIAQARERRRTSREAPAASNGNCGREPWEPGIFMSLVQPARPPSPTLHLAALPT